MLNKEQLVKGAKVYHSHFLHDMSKIITTEYELEHVGKVVRTLPKYAYKTNMEPSMVIETFSATPEDAEQHLLSVLQRKVTQAESRLHSAQVMLQEAQEAPKEILTRQRQIEREQEFAHMAWHNAQKQEPSTGAQS